MQEKLRRRHHPENPVPVPELEELEETVETAKEEVRQVQKKEIQITLVQRKASLYSMVRLKGSDLYRR